LRKEEKMSSLFDEKAEVQLARAQAKIYSGWVDPVSPIDPYSEMYGRLCVRMLGDYCRGWVWSKNWAPARSEGSAPSGFQLNVSPRAPLFLRPFSPTALFSGTLCYPLSAGARTSLCTSTNQPISHEHFANVGLNIESNMRDRVKDDIHLGGDGNSNYAGIFWSFEGNKHQFYCVVQSHDASLSQQAMSLIRDHEPDSLESVADYARALLSRNPNDIAELAEAADDALSSIPKNKAPFTTWMDMFFKNEKMRQIMALQRRHRAEVALQTMRAVGVGPPTRGSREECIQAILDESSASHTMTNYVEIIDSSDPLSDLVYLSNLTSAWDTTDAGVIVRSSFDEGLALIRGTTNNPGFLEEDEKLHRASFIGLPVCTGPIWRSKAFYAPSSTSYVYSAAVPSHPMLNPDNWLSRAEPSWAAWEKECGLSGTCTILKPSRVRLSLP
jgi:hypothetical protein